MLTATRAAAHTRQLPRDHVGSRTSSGSGRTFPLCLLPFVLIPPASSFHVGRSSSRIRQSGQIIFRANDMGGTPACGLAACELGASLQSSQLTPRGKRWCKGTRARTWPPEHVGIALKGGHGDGLRGHCLVQVAPSAHNCCQASVTPPPGSSSVLTAHVTWVPSAPLLEAALRVHLTRRSGKENMSSIDRSSPPGNHIPKITQRKLPASAPVVLHHLRTLTARIYRALAEHFPASLALFT